MKKLQLAKMSLGQGQYRGKVSLVSDSCEPGTLEDRLFRLDLLQAVANDPQLQSVAGKDFQTMKMYFAGGQWQIDLEADL
jgi:hypothetical protein